MIPAALPIEAVRDDLVAALNRVPRVVLSAPTGSGKSTRVPGFLADALPGRGRIICLQPRRLAARMLARRVARERNSAIGDEVGYRVRFDHRVGPRTRIVYETDGILLRELLDRPDIPEVAAIVFDEFHERHLFGDVLLGLALRLQVHRPDLRLIVMSATLDMQSGLAQRMDPFAAITTSGRGYPVTIRYQAAAARARPQPLSEIAVQALVDHADDLGSGHTLIFMPGAHDIRLTCEALSRHPATRGRAILPLYGELPAAQQDAAAAPDAGQAIIVSTNIAETSLTIDGVTGVIDSGLARQAGFDPALGVNTLFLEAISQASAEQRAGRAGRTAPGVCVRLWSETGHVRRPLHPLPEIQRVDLCEILLQLAALDIMDPLDFPWVDSPDPERVTAGFELLIELGALDPTTHRITGLGSRMLAYPLHPRWARLLCAAIDNDCLEEASLAAALAQEREFMPPTRDRAIREQRRQWLDPSIESDILLRVALWRHIADHRFDDAVCRRLGLQSSVARRIKTIASQFKRIAQSTPNADQHRQSATRPSEAARITQCILAAFPDRVAVRASAGASRFRMTGGRRGILERDSTIRRAGLIVAPEINQVESRPGEIEVRLRLAGELSLEQLTSTLALQAVRRTAFDPVHQRVTVSENLVYQDLTVATRGTGLAPTADESAACLAGEVLAGRITLKHWNTAVDQWIRRLNSLTAWCPELGLPPIDAAGRNDIIEQICHGVDGAKSLKTKPVRPIVEAWLSDAQHTLLDRHAPERVRLANGKNVKLIYETEGQPPHFSARLQELYDIHTCPHIAMGRVRVRACILAPNQRPVQITDDLTSFWSDTYEQVKKDLRGRYPKHEWR